MRGLTLPLFIFSLLGISLPARAADNALSEADKRSGWKLLFDGKTSQGWRNYKKDSLGKGWVVKDGALVRDDKGAGDIITNEQFDNFELSIEYKISKGGNSGIMFHVTEKGGAPWHTGPEVQIQDNVDGHDPQKSGWLYQLYQPPMDPATKKIFDSTRPAGEWNQLQLLVTRDQCELNMNGLRYWTCKIGSKEWNDRVGKSKFAKLEGFGSQGKGFICLQDHGNAVAYKNIKIRKLPANGAAPDPIDGKLSLKVEPAFDKVQWTGWEPADDAGKNTPLRPILLTHAGDGSNRVFMATQQGVIHVIPNGDSQVKSKVFLDLKNKVRYEDKENEEGLLGLAFHPQYKKNGEFFLYYTVKNPPHQCVVSRFKASKTDPDKADPDFEEVLLELPQPFWNHKGGTILFGPDGYLYIGLGDGGAANDPFNNGQNLKTLLGSILRIDVNSKDSGKKYGIPKDNPFVSRDDALPEIYAYGFRNIWRMAFDKKTGALFAADVGQNLWEEINIVEKGGNFGWNLRESMHPFGGRSPGSQKFIEPIWEYDHQVGKSITGGTVYRGKKVPELYGKYLYADYVSGKIWALDYDQQKKQVRGNYAIPSPMFPIINIGEDQEGELYFSVVTGNGKGIYRFVSTQPAKATGKDSNVFEETYRPKHAWIKNFLSRWRR